MIVKNEARIIRRCFDSVLPYLSYWVIQDTGSTDDTQQMIIDYFMGHGIPGELYELPFQNFGYNRTKALQSAQETKADFDYILLIDADMTLDVKQPDMFPSRLVNSVYQIEQFNNSLQYFNSRLLRKGVAAEYKGVTHEYLSIDDGNVSAKRLSTVVLFDHVDGGCKQEKFTRDQRLLEATHREDPTDARTLFYLAQTYKDTNQLDLAIQTYEKHQLVQTWEEEVYYSKFMVAQCKEKQGMYKEAIVDALAAHQYRPTRGESLHLAVRICREKGLNLAAWVLSEIGAQIRKPEGDVLFLDTKVYTYKFLFEKSILAYYVSQMKSGLEACNTLLLSSDVDRSERAITRSNLNFYMQPLAGATHVQIPKPDGYPEYNVMNPSLVWDGEAMCVNLRLVNYAVGADQSYTVLGGPDKGLAFTNERPVHTVNVLRRDGRDTPVSTDDLWLRYTKYTHGMISGVEDLRLFMHKGEIYFSGTCPQVDPGCVNQMVMGRLDKDGVAHDMRLLVLPEDFNRRCEKNWMLFSVDDEVLCFYDAVTILVVDPDTGSLTLKVRNQSRPGLSDFRGSAGPILVHGRWFGMIHEVLMTTDAVAKRVYIHRFIEYDPRNNWCLLKIGLPFRFSAQETRNNIEYGIGMCFHPEDKKMYLSWGEGDAKAYLTIMSDADFLQQFV
jgi:glycosyltransferase involved in cell wall biosynthesis